MLQKWVRPDGVHFWDAGWGVVIREVPGRSAWDAFPESLLYIKVPGDKEGKLFPNPPHSYTQKQFDYLWGFVPDRIRHEIIECFYDVNPAYREAVVG